MGFDRSGSAYGNLARSYAQHDGYASGKALHPHTGSANTHANRDAHSNGDSNTDPHTNANPNRDSYIYTYSKRYAYSTNSHSNTNEYIRNTGD